MIAFRTASILGGPPRFHDIPIPKLTKGHALVKMKYSALNRRDYKIWNGKYPHYKVNCTMGSDGFGSVIDVFDIEHEKWLGQEVIINPNINWGDNQKIPSDSYEILGMPTDGTFAEYVSVNVNRLHSPPLSLTGHELAAIPLSSLTAYSLIFGGGHIKSNSDVLITGAGGGVSQMAIKMAHALGANVFTTSSSNEKLEIINNSGLTNSYLYTDRNWVEDLRSDIGGLDVIIDSSGGNQINQLLNLLNKGGDLLIYGATNGVPSNIDLLTLYYKQLTIRGYMMGSDEDFSDMLSFINEHNISPLVDSVIDFTDIESGFRLMEVNNKMGKIVLKM